VTTRTRVTRRNQCSSVQWLHTPATFLHTLFWTGPAWHTARSVTHLTVLSQCTISAKRSRCPTGFHFSIPRQKNSAVHHEQTLPHLTTPAWKFWKPAICVAGLMSFLCTQNVRVELVILKLHMIDVTGYPKQFSCHSRQILR